MPTDACIEDVHVAYAVMRIVLTQARACYFRARRTLEAGCSLWPEKTLFQVL